MKNKYKIKSAFFLIGCLIETFSFPTYDQTFTGYGTAVAYQGTHVDAFLDPHAITNEGFSASPYGIVTIGTCFFNTTALPNYPTLGSLPCISRFNRDGTPDTNFGNYFPGTGSYTFDASANLSFPSFENNYLQFGKLVYMNTTGSTPTYFVVYRNQSANPVANCMIYKYMPLTGRIDYNVDLIGGQNIPLKNQAGSPITATITSACTVPVSGTAQTSAQTTSNIYITYYDAGGNSYIAALTYSTITNLFTYDTSFATNGVIKFATGTGGAGTIHFNSINYDSSANAGAGALIVAGTCTLGGSKVIIARYKNLTATAILDTAFNTTGYVIVAAPGGATAAVISKYIFSKIVSGTQYYYCAGWNVTGPVLNICYLNPATAAFVSVGGGDLKTVSTFASSRNYQIYDMAQIPDFSGTNAVAVAVGVNISGQPTLAGIIDFRFEAPMLDLGGNAVALTEVNSLTALGQSSLDLSFYSCLFDPTLYAASPTDLPGIFVGGNFGSPAYGCFVNYTYKGTPTIGMIPAVGVRTGIGLFDYASSEYPNGFSFEQVFYFAADGTASYYISGQAQDAYPYSYPGIFRFDITNNSFNFTL